MLKGFRDFISRGNVIDLAVAVVIGTAFQLVVKQFTDSFLNPLIKLASGGKAVSGTFKVQQVVFDWGTFVNVLIGFILTAAVVYFLVVMPMNKLAELRRRGEVPEPSAPSDEVRLLTEIRDALLTGDHRASAPGPGGEPPVRPTSVR